MIKAFAYLRVSSKGQSKGHGPQRQEEIIREFAAANGYVIEHVYSDAHTGTEADRPQFVEMLATIMDNGVRTVIVESLDRLARDLLIQSQLLAKLAAEGVQLISASTGEDVTEAIQLDPMRKAMVQIQGVFAELDKNLTVRKLRKAREAKKVANGKCEGAKPFGFYPDEGPVLEYMRQLSRKRVPGKLTNSEIAGVLNRAGMRNRSGNEWTRKSISQVLKAQGKTKRPQRTTEVIS